MGSQVLHVHCADVVSADRYTARGGFVQSLQKSRDGGLSGTGRPDYRYAFVFPQFEGDVLQDGYVCPLGVGELDV